MGKVTLWIILGILVIGLIIYAWKYSEKHGNPLSVDPSKMEKMDESEFLTDDQVLVTMEDYLYHLPGCKHIQGMTQRMTIDEAEEKGLTPCPYCLGEYAGEETEE